MAHNISSLALAGVEFKNNFANRSGGGLYFATDRFNESSCALLSSDNGSVLLSPPPGPNSIASDGRGLDLVDVVLTNNTALLGGGGGAYMLFNQTRVEDQDSGLAATISSRVL